MAERILCVAWPRRVADVTVPIGLLGAAKVGVFPVGHRAAQCGGGVAAARADEHGGGSAGVREPIVDCEPVMVYTFNHARYTPVYTFI